MKYRFLTIILFATLILSSCSSPTIPSVAPTALLPTPTPAPNQTGKALTSVNVCYSAITGTQAVVWYAYEKALFLKYGLEVKLTYISSGTTAVTALLAGNIDICQVAGSSVVNAVAAGQDAVMIAGLYNIYPASLMVIPGIKTAQDLTGKALAISQPGSSTDVGIRMVLKQFGLIPDKDVTLLAIGEESARMAAMDTGQVAGSLLTSPDTLIEHQKGDIELANLATMNIPYQHTGIATTRKYISGHQTVVEDFMKAILDAIHQMKKDPAGTKAVMAKYLLLDPDKNAASLDDAYQTLILNSLSIVPYPSLPGIQTIIDYEKATNPAVANLLPDQVVDMTILKNLETNGFITGLGK
jgi:NitT/TauT family transport system substrate-binding protein